MGNGNLDAVIFDVDGTLADTEEAHRRAFNTAFAAHGLGWTWSAELYSGLLRVTGGKERIAHYIESFEACATEKTRLMTLIPAVHRSKTLAFVELVRRGEVQPRTGIRRFLGEARSAGIRLAIASTTSAENVEALLAGSLGPHISQWFDVIATGDVVANKKPAPDIYRLALSSLGVAPRNAVAIEDSQIGVQAATAAGLVTIATPTRWTAEQDFAAAELVLRSLDDLDVGHLAALHGAALHRMENHADTH